MHFVGVQLFICRALEDVLAYDDVQDVHGFIALESKSGRPTGSSTQLVKQSLTVPSTHVSEIVDLWC